MSKTIRRKTNYDIDKYIYHWEKFVILNKNFHFILLEYYEYNKIYNGTYFYKNNKKFIKELNKYHTDNNTEYNAPKYFRKQLNKKYRIKCNRIMVNLNNDRKNNKFDNLVFPLHKKTMNWEWF